jgi:hypothetical protein
VADVWLPMRKLLGSWRARLFSRENLLALLLCLIFIAVIVMTSDTAPRWIYQGF